MRGGEAARRAEAGAVYAPTHLLLLPHLLGHGGALCALPASLVALDDGDGLVRRHVHAYVVLFALLLQRDPFHAEFERGVAVDQLVPRAQPLVVVLGEVAWNGHLQRLRRQLEVDEQVVQIDILPGKRLHRAHVRVGRVPFDQPVLEHHHAPDDRLQHLLHVLTLLWVHHCVVALLQVAENLEVPDVSRSVVLEVLLRRQLLRLRPSKQIQHRQV